MSHKHVGQGLNFVPQGDGSVKIVKLWRNLPDGVELEVHLSKEEWRKVVAHCEHQEPIYVEDKGAVEAQKLAEEIAKELPKKKGVFK